MTRYRQVRILETAVLANFMFIIWSMLTMFMFRTKINLTALLVSLPAMYLMEFLKSRKLNKYLSIGVPAALCVFLKFYDIFVIIMLLLDFSNEDGSIDFYLSKEKMERATVILICFGILLFGFGQNDRLLILRLYFSFFILSLIYLVEARAYFFNLNRKFGLFFDGIGLATLVVLCSDPVLRFLSKIIGFVFGKLYDLFALAVTAFGYVFFTLFGETIMNAILSFANKHVKGLKMQENKAQDFSDAQQKLLHATVVKNLPPFVVITLEIAFTALIIFIIYKLMNRARVKEAYVFDSKVTIEKLDMKKESSRKHYHYGRSNLDRIRKTYFNFEKWAVKKGIYKSCYTAGEIHEKALGLADDSSLMKLKNLYNTSKFSNTDASKEMVDEAYEALKKIKK